MLRQFIFFLSGWLLLPPMAALAAMPQQPCVRAHSPLLCGDSFVACTMPPQIAGVFPAKGALRSSSKPSPVAQNAAQKRRAVAESMMQQRAWMYSAVLPGWGQVYNAHYWKVPFIYLGFAGFGWGAIYYHKEYIRSKQRLLRVKEGGSLASYVSACRQDRDLFIILAALWYVVNILDAYVGVSLKTFTLSDDISMEIQPSMLPTMKRSPHIGLSLTLNFGA